MSRPDLARAVFLRRPEQIASRVRRDDDVIFRADSVAKHFGGVFAVDDVTLDVRAGEILGIIGPNGAGKSTFIGVCSGFLPPDSGRLMFHREDVTGLRPSELSERGVGRTFQDARLWSSLTTREALAVALDRHIEVREPLACAFRGSSVIDSERAVWQRVDEVLASTGLEPYRDSFLSELSTGTRRILELACAIAHGPELLFLDEPTAGVAQRESEVLGELLVDLRDRQHVTLVVVEHNIPVVSAISDRMVCFDLGSVLAEGSPKSVLSDKAVLSSYLGEQTNGTKKKSRARARA
jgi:branched-chain amino acid transport system ATP-binding protein